MRPESLATLDIINGSVLYLGKTTDLHKRLRGQFSGNIRTNALGRKLYHLIAGENVEKIDKEKKDEIFCSIEIYYLANHDWFQRELLRSFGKAVLKPIFNLEAEY